MNKKNNIRTKKKITKHFNKPPVDKEHLIQLASEILCRVELAENAYNNTVDWYNEDCDHTDEDLTYWEWISQAEEDFVKAVKAI